MSNENSVLVVKNLNRWFKEKWVDVSRKDKDGKHPPCGRGKAKKGSKGYPKCRPSVRVSSKTPKTSGEMTGGQKQAATKRKRAKKQGVGGKPTIVKGNPLDLAWRLLKEDTFVPIGEHAGRKIAMFNDKPYYISKEGTSGKAKGQWYGFGGVDPDGSKWHPSIQEGPWFIKGEEGAHEDIPPHARYKRNDEGEVVHSDIRSQAGRVGAHAERYDGEYPFLRSAREVNQLLSQHGFTPPIKGDYPTEVLKGDCPTPSKGKYSNQAAAQRAADYQSQQSGQRISVYRCQQVGGGGCGFWHLTSG